MNIVDNRGEEGGDFGGENGEHHWKLRIRPPLGVKPRGLHQSDCIYSALTLSHINLSHISLLDHIFVLRDFSRQLELSVGNLGLIQSDFNLSGSHGRHFQDRKN